MRIVTSPSANRGEQGRAQSRAAATMTGRAATHAPRWLLLAVAGSRRVRLMQAACSMLGLPACEVLEWRDWLEKPHLLDERLQAMQQVQKAQQAQDGQVQSIRFKIEPPGDDPQAHHDLLREGCRLLDRPLPAMAEYGQLQAMDCWFAGFEAAMQRLARQLALLPTSPLPPSSRLAVINAPSEIILMTDKLRCQQHLAACGIPIPPLFGAVASYDDMRALMASQHCGRVFLKARYGSSAAGVLAYRCTPDGREQAISSAQLQGRGRDARLFNSKRMQRYHDRRQIAELVDLLCRQQAYLEAWIAKPRLGRAHYDVRVLTLAGRAAQRVARIGEFAMTNLHLGNRRGNPEALLAPSQMQQLQQLAEQAACAFSGSGIIGFDLVPGQGGARVLEANAFGDLLPDLLWQGQDSYGAQLHCFGAKDRLDGTLSQPQPQVPA